MVESTIPGDVPLAPDEPKGDAYVQDVTETPAGISSAPLR